MKLYYPVLDLIPLTPEQVAMEKMLRHLPEAAVLILLLVIVVALLVRKTRK